MNSTTPAKRRLGANIAANFAYVGVMALITLVATPLYVRGLGTAWNYIALCLTIQGLVFLLDAAISPLMLRDVARAQRSGQAAASYRRFSRMYAAAGVLVFVIGEAATWLVAEIRRADGAPLPVDLSHALQLVFIQFLFQFGSNAATGYWNAAERQGLANSRLALFAVAKHVLALTFVFVWHTATAYMLPFVVIGAVECLANHRRLRREHPAIPLLPDAADDWRDVRQYGAGTALALAATQVDRWYLCLVLPADLYGIYFLATSFMLSMFSLQVPIIRAFAPRMAVAERPQAVAAAMRRLLLALIALPAVLLAAAAPIALQLWLHDAAIADAAAPTFRLLMLAVAMNAVFAPTGTLLMHQHRYRSTATLNGAILVVQLGVLAVLTPRLGMLAGACAWLAWAAIQFAYAGYHLRHATHR